MNIAGFLFKDSSYIFCSVMVYTLVSSNVTMKIIDFFRFQKSCCCQSYAFGFRVVFMLTILLGGGG